MHDLFDCCRVTLDVRIRRCREDDLPALEWFGLFAPHRALIRKVFEQQQQGQALMLVAEVNGEASGQAWIDWSARNGGAAELWAVRILPCLQRRGIGARLVEVAERLAFASGCTEMQLGVDTDNSRARHFWERLGYRYTATAVTTHRTGAHASKQWLMAKALPVTMTPAEVEP
ncbi:MAG: GNAT family N-acetyltransferase [Ramlibacter sp.]